MSRAGPVVAQARAQADPALVWARADPAADPADRGDREAEVEAAPAVRGDPAAPAGDPVVAAARADPVAPV